MILEVGKKYNCRSGEKTAVITGKSGDVYIGSIDGNGSTWRSNGNYYWNGKQHSKDLVSEHVEQSYGYPFYAGP